MTHYPIYYYNMYAPHNIVRRVLGRAIFNWADARYGVEARHMPPVTITFTKFDKDTGQFRARAPGYSEYTAVIARDGITIPFGWNGVTCSVRFNAIEGEYLTGMAKCDTNSLKLRTALP